ncbi:alanine racemase [Desulfothermus naphthae]
MESLVIALVDLTNIAHNLREVKKIISSNTEIMAVVKANGYGHGAAEVAKVVLREGASYLGVARLEEALDLRKKGIFQDILIFGYISPSDLEIVKKYNFIVSIFDKTQATEYIKKCKELGCRMRIHIKVDTGMGRVGYVLSDKDQKKQAISDIKELLKVDEFSVEGIYTHFARADEQDLSYSKMQLGLFKELINELSERVNKKIKYHAANSAAIIQLPDSHLDIVRPGIMLYGLYPSRYLKDSTYVQLKPAMSLISRIVQIKKVTSGFKVSYGSTYITKRRARLATVPVGYADGYPRLLSNRGYVLINGKFAKIAGRICMDQFLVDITDVDAAVGDKVVLFGKYNSFELSVDEVAELAQTINYEIVSQISSRVKRVYIGDF